MSTPSKTAVQAARKRLHWAKSRKVKIVLDCSRLRDAIKKLECFASMSHEAALIVEELFCIWGRSLKTDAKRRGDTLRVTVNANVDVYRVIDTAEIAFTSGSGYQSGSAFDPRAQAIVYGRVQLPPTAPQGEASAALASLRRHGPSKVRGPIGKSTSTASASSKNSKRAQRGKASK